PAARRGHARRRRCRRCPRRHLAPRPDQRARSLRRPSPQTDAAPASPLAPANRMENPVGQRHRPLLPDRPTTRRLTHRPVPVRPAARPDPRNPKESWYRPADQACATVPIPGRRSGKPRQRPHEITHPRIQAKAQTIARLFGGNADAWAAFDPTTVITRHGPYTGVAGWFAISRDAAGNGNDQAAAANSLCALGTANGIKCAVVAQPGKHDWPFASHAFAAALPWLARQLGTPGVPAVAM